MKAALLAQDGDTMAMSPLLVKAIEATGANALDHARAPYAQFSQPLSKASYAALDAVLAANPSLWLRVYAYGLMHDVEFLRALPSARRVWIDHGPIADWSGMTALAPDLEMLTVAEYAKPVPLAEISKRTGLVELELTTCAAREYSLLASLSKLKRLALRKGNLGGRLDDIARGTPAMHEVELRGCKVASLGFLAHWPALRKLEWASGRLSLDTLPALPQLRFAELQGLESQTLDGAPRLEELEVWDNRALDDVSAVTKLPHLRALTLRALPKLRKLPALESLTSLRSLSIGEVPIDSLAEVAALPALESLHVWKCPLGSADFAVLRGHPTLKELEVDIDGRKVSALCQGAAGF